MQTGEWLTRLTADLSLLLYAVALLLRLCAAGRVAWLTRARILWTAGCAALWLHLGCAFQFVHHWSHPLALAATERRTFEQLGIQGGGAGIYANYAFAIVWLIDAVWWWRGLDAYALQPAPLRYLVQGYLAFIAFNATVVFGHGPVRWTGLVTSVLLAAIWICRPRGPAPPPPPVV